MCSPVHLAKFNIVDIFASIGDLNHVLTALRTIIDFYTMSSILFHFPTNVKLTHGSCKPFIYKTLATSITKKFYIIFIICVLFLILGILSTK